MNRRRALLGWLAGLAISVVALWVLVQLIDIEAAARVLSKADPVPLLGVIPIIGIQLLLRSFRWRALLDVTKPPTRLRIARLVPVLLIGYLANAVLPARLGEPIRAYLVARRERLDGAQAFGTVVLERILDTASLAALAFVAALIAPGPAWLIQALAIALLAAAVIVILLVTGAMGPVLQWSDRLAAMPRFPIVAIPARVLHGIAIGADGARRPRAVVLAVGVSLVCWLLDATTFWLVGRSVGVSLPIAGAVLIAAVTVLGTALPSAPGYIGTFDLAAAATATALGVPASSALALAVLAHAVTVLPLAAAGAVALVASGSRLSGLVGEPLRSNPTQR